MVIKTDNELGLKLDSELRAKMFMKHSENEILSNPINEHPDVLSKWVTHKYYLLNGSDNSQSALDSYNMTINSLNDSDKELLLSYFGENIQGFHTPKLNNSVDNRFTTGAHPMEVLAKSIYSADMICDLVSEDGYDYMYPTNTANEIIKKIKVEPNKFDYKILRSIPNKKMCFLMGESCVLFCKINQFIIGAFISVKDNNLSWDIFKINTTNGSVSFKPEGSFIDPLYDSNFKYFIQLLCYTELSELEVKVIPPNKSIGETRKNKIANRSDLNITIIDSNWNKIVVKTDKFGVSGHIRMQWVGKGRNRLKPIYIKPYTKNGYARKATREFR